MRNINQAFVERLEAWIADYFRQNGPEAKAVIGISGGKDSTVVAALCAAALGPDRVVGVLMPQHIQHDIDVSAKVVQELDIEHYTINIGSACDALYDDIKIGMGRESLPHGVLSNAPARIRMTTLYAVAATCHGRVANTCNKSETFIGWETKYGDAAGDFAPISQLTTEEVIAVGRVLKVPEEFLTKIPEDGLSGKTDEEAFGFSYADLNEFIEKGENCGLPDELKERIMEMFIRSQHKRQCIHIPYFDPDKR